MTARLTGATVATAVLEVEVEPHDPDGATTIRTIRRIGLALASFVVAWLVMGLTFGYLLPWLGFTPTPTPTVPPAGAPMLIAFAGLVATVVLGGLIYRDILRRE